MKTVNESDFYDLVRHCKTHSVSIYMPVFAQGDRRQENPIRLKNLLGEARARLITAGLSEREAEAKLAELSVLAQPTAFWDNPGRGLAIFVSNGDNRAFRLPVEPEELVVVNDRFHLTPLFPMVTENARFLLLALSEHGTRLFEADRFGIDEIELPHNTPADIDELMQYVDAERHVEFHTGAGDTGPPAGDRPAEFHGQGVAGDKQTDRTRSLEFCRQVDNGLEGLLEKRQLPLVLAAVEPLEAIYREANRYERLHPETIAVNPDDMTADRLHAEAVKRLDDFFHTARHRIVRAYKDNQQTDRTSCEIDNILRAAHTGQVASLIVSLDAHRWGTADLDNLEFQRHSERQDKDIDLLNLAAVRAATEGGDVIALHRDDLPQDNPLMAVYRFESS